VLTIQSRSVGLAGGCEHVRGVDDSGGGFTTTASALRSRRRRRKVADGSDGVAEDESCGEDWHASFFAALGGYEIVSTASFSMELGNGDPSRARESRRWDRRAIRSCCRHRRCKPIFRRRVSRFWQEVYAEMAGIQAAAGLTPFLQFGEVQWWYFFERRRRHSYSGMPFYDAWNQSQFLAEFGTAMAVITTNTVNPASYPNEVSYLPGVIGNFTNAIMTFVRTSEASCRFEVLYPTDTNQTTFNQAINYPVTALDTVGARRY